MLARAKALGVTVPTDWSPDTLGQVLSVVEQQQAQAARAVPATPPAQTKVEEPAVDWGEDDDGKPLTEEAAKKVYPRAVFNAIKAQSRLEKIEAENKSFRESFEQDRRERTARRNERELNKILATRPDLFGDPEAIQPGSIEDRRKRAVIADLNHRWESKQATTMQADAVQAMEVFGPAPAKTATQDAARHATPAAPAAKPTPTLNYQAGELARPTGRRGTQIADRRTLMIEEEQRKQLEANGSTVAISGDDSSDLPDAPKG